MKPLKILIAGGGTGGHLFPGIAIAEEFLEHFPCDIRFVGSKRGLEAKILPQTPFDLYTIPISGLYRVGLKRKILTLAKLPLAVVKSLWILISFRPRLVIGIGGYASGPILALSIVLGKKTVIQEQNAYPGMTNRLLGRYAKLAFIPFQQTAHLFKNPVVVGNPIRKAIKSAGVVTHTQSPQTVVIAVVGGSQGAHLINATIAKMLPDLAQSRMQIELIHQTGRNDYTWLEEEYQKYPVINAKVSEFIDDMVTLYRQCHLLICRSGSMINEIVAMGKASILIPITAASGDHQRENARVLSDAGAAIMIEERDLTAEHLLKTITEILSEPDRLAEMGVKARSLYKGDSAQKIVSTIFAEFKLFPPSN